MYLERQQKSRSRRTSLKTKPIRVKHIPERATTSQIETTNKEEEEEEVALHVPWKGSNCLNKLLKEEDKENK